MILTNLKKDLEILSNSKKKKVLQSFFKTGKGEYGEGDIFIGVTVPNSRIIAKKYKDLPLKDAERLLHSTVHEERLVALLILVEKFNKIDEKEKQRIFNLYLRNTKYVNNWDLVDLSAPKIVGAYLLDRNKEILNKLAKSKSLWGKRISIISTLFFISNNQFDKALEIADVLLNDKHDLIHKAVGWTLREVGKRNQNIEEKFLKKNYKNMPRTALRYAIERFPEKLRQKYLKGEV